MILELIATILSLVGSWMVYKKMGRQGWEGALSPFTTPMSSARSCTATAGNSSCS